MSDRHLTPILCLKQVDLKSGIGSDYLLQNISFDIHPGEKVAVVGSSGAGKTSLLRLLNRLVSPSRGNIYLGDASAKQLTTIQLRRMMVLVAQEPKLLNMKVGDALSYPLELQQLSKLEIRQRIDTWANRLHISDQWLNKTELQLSLGQRQLVAIARALVMEPQILLLDEPTSALDIGTANHLLSVLDEFSQSSNLTLIMVNHQLGLIKNFCDHILYLNSGQLEEDIPATTANWQKIEQKMIQLKIKQDREWS